MTLYLIPYLFFNAVYAVPEFVVHLHHRLSHEHGLSGHLHAAAVLAPILIGAIVFGAIARVISEYFYPDERTKGGYGYKASSDFADVEEKYESWWDSYGYTIIILAGMGVLIALIFFASYLIATEPPPAPAATQALLFWQHYS